MFLTEDKVLMW